MGYGLTCGVHTRIDETVAQVVRTGHAGNLYVNRNVVGAVVGVQPFGGEGLSGTGPKAGGPLHVLRLLSQAPAGAARAAVCAAVCAAGARAAPPVRGLEVDRHHSDSVDADNTAALQALQRWATAQGLSDVAQACVACAKQALTTVWRALRGSTGEANLYAVRPRAAVLCLAPAAAAGDTLRLMQLAAVLAVGSRAVWPVTARALWDRLGAELREHITLAQNWQAPTVASFDAVLHSGPQTDRLQVLLVLAQRSGPFVGVTVFAPAVPGLTMARLVTERSLSINTAAAGCNASQMTLGQSGRPLLH